MILFEKVTKQFPNGTIALQEVSFHIEPGEFAFIVGPSGAGKTTILRLLLRELEPTSGDIIIEGQNLMNIKKKHLAQHRRKIGAAFQDFKLIEDRTVRENVSLVSEMIVPKFEEVKEHVQDILTTVGLGDRGDLFPSQLSGGELQRTAIARALATHPKILFADEPTGNLDQATGWEIIKVLLEINKSGTTVMVATHNQEFVKALRKRVIELEEGRIIQDSKPTKEEDQKQAQTEKKEKAIPTKEKKVKKDQQKQESKKDNQQPEK